MKEPKKVCRDCGKMKVVSKYTLSNKARLIYRPECKECAAKNWREKHKYASKKYIERESGRMKLFDKMQAIRVLLKDIEKEYKKMQKLIDKIGD